MEHINQDTALLVMDVQDATIKRIQPDAPFIHAVNNAVQAARRYKIPVIFVVIGFRKGYPEISPHNKSFPLLKSGGLNLDSEEGAKIHALVEQHPGDLIVTKKRVSAFAGSDLEIVLRSLGIKHLVLSGIATSGVVLSTVREAADKDFVLTVLSDCCADVDEEVHRVLTTKLFPRQAEVITSEEWCAKSHS